VMAVFIAGVIVLALRVRNAPAERDRYLLMLGAAVVVFWLLQMDYFGFRPWRAIWALVPGGSAIRYTFRSQLVANLFVGLVVARVLAGMMSRPGLTVLCGFLMIEQINLVWPPTVSRRRDAPITATELGSRNARTAATAACRSRSSKHARASPDSDVGSSMSIEPGVECSSTGKPLRRKTSIIRWLAGSTCASKVAMPCCCATSAS